MVIFSYGFSYRRFPYVAMSCPYLVMGILLKRNVNGNIPVSARQSVTVG